MPAETHSTQEPITADEVFGMVRPGMGSPWYDFKVCAVDPVPLRTSVGFTIDTPYRIGDLASAGTIIAAAISPALRHE